MADDNAVDLPAEFERLLRQELSIEPSPAYAARVRARVGEKARRSSWWRARWIPAIGSAATVASIGWALLVPALSRVAAPPGPPPAPAASQIAVDHGRLDPWTLPARVTATSRVGARPAPTERVIAADMTVVIVDRKDRVALDRFVTMLQEGRVAEDAFAHTSKPAAFAIEEMLSPIVVTPVAVSSISAGGVLPSETERK